MYAVDYLELLKNKPLASKFVDEYFTNDKLLNAMDFSSGAVNTNANGLGYTVVRNEGGSAASREFGQDYESSNSTPVPETFYLKVLGGKYSVDSTLEDVTKNITTENEARVKFAATVNEFARQFIKGDIAKSGEFEGLEKYCAKHNLISELVLALPTPITEADAVAFSTAFTELVGELDVDANAIVCSRAMESKLVAVDSVLHKNVQRMTLGKLNYNTFLNVPIIGLDNKIGLRKTDEITDDVTEDIYIMKISSIDGVFCGSPADKSAFVKVVPPVSTGGPLATGYVDFATTLIPKNRKALRKASVLIEEGTGI